jgi:hypothetical protein
MAKKPSKRLLSDAGREMHSSDRDARDIAGRVLREGRKGGRKRGRKSSRKSSD